MPIRATPTRRDAPLAICYGTRPQVIKASVLLDALGERWGLLSVDTGQHYDYELNALQYEQLGVKKPDVHLEVGSADHATQTSAILARASAVLRDRSPWAVVVIGDTNSTLGCALAAAQLHIPVVHVEAGMRARDPRLVEEMNRRVVDVVSAVLCAPSAAAADRLREEKVQGTVALVGDVARDVLERNIGRARRASDCAGWPLPPAEPFIFATLHRAELVDDVPLLVRVLDGLGRLSLPVILATHPRTRNALTRSGVGSALPRSVRFLPPLGYLETLACIRDARAVVTDSGGVQREAYWLGTPCVTVRGETEWKETVELGANTLFPPEGAADGLAEVVTGRLRSSTATPWNRDAYGAGDAAARIREVLIAAGPMR